MMKRHYFAKPFLFVAAMALLNSFGCQGQEDTAEASPGAQGTSSQSPLFTNPIQYAYDVMGRLIAVYDTSGNSAQYVYDAVGNIQSVTRFTSTTLALFDFSPHSGPVGSSVVLTGSGFSTTLASNTVKFNGTTATVTAATAQQLAVAVPSGATTGTVTVTVSGTTKTSTATFTVGASGPSITSFTPTSGNANTVLTVTGSGFETVMADDAAAIGEQFAQVTAATTTQLTAIAPLSSGKVSVTTPRGYAVSTQDFFQIPAGLTAGSIGYSGRVVADGSSLTVTLPVGGKSALVLFDGNTRDQMGLGITPISLSNGGYVNVQLNDSLGNILASYYAYPAQAIQQLPPLPGSGTYMLILTPSSTSSTMSATLTLSHVITGAFAVDGPQVTYSTTRPGQFGFYSFTPAAGAHLTLTLSNSTFADSDAIKAGVYDANQNLIQSIAAYANAIVSLDSLTAQTYQLVFTPATAGQVSINLKTDAAGSAGTLNGSATNLSQVTYQNGEYTFSATAGNYVGFGVSSFTTVPAGTIVTYTVYDPSNNYVHSCAFNSTSSCPFGKMPVTGTYLLTVVPQAVASVSTQALLSLAVTGSITVGGSPATFTTSRVGQDGQYTFTATAGQNVTLGLTACTFPTGIGATVTDSSGSFVTSPSCGVGSPGSATMTGLAAGTYTITMAPSGIDTGSATISLN